MSRNAVSGHILAVVTLAQFFLAGGLQSAEVGSLPGEFSVTPQGAATYRVPIEVPPGIGGLHPDLALTYNSQRSDARGNGHFGVGWSLSGLSAITRCPATLDSNGYVGSVTYTASDRFCLDGQQLMMISAGTYGDNGMQYRTEVESFQAVWSYGSAGGGPDWFELKDKAGYIREYGSSADSQIEVQGGSAIAVWTLTKIRDRFGNYIKFDYGERTDAGDNGEYWLKNVYWYNRYDQQLGRVIFDTNTSRPDKSFGYTYGGSRQSLERRVYRIRVFGRNSNTSNKIREYQLGYTPGATTGLSQLSTITLCNGVGQCMNPTAFTYEDGTPDIESSRITLGQVPTDTKFIDYDGDSKLDFLYPQDNYWRFRRSSSHTGGTTEYSTGIPTSQHYHDAKNTHVLDYDGDGNQDLLVANKNGTWNVLLSTGSGFTLVSTGAAHDGTYNDKPLAVDLDRDLRSDLIIRYGGALRVLKNSATGFNVTSSATGLSIKNKQILSVIEFDGDAFPEILVSQHDCSNGASCAVTAGVLQWDGSTLVAEDPNAEVRLKDAVTFDVNGDGLTDIVHGSNFNSPHPNKWNLYLNTGGQFAHSWYGHNNTENLKYADAIDFNSDGKDDLLIPQNGEWKVLLADAEGDGLLTPFNSGATVNGHTTAFFSDASGDGLPDMYFHDNSNWRVSLMNGEMRGLLSSVEDGLGSRTSVDHFSLASWTTGWKFDGVSEEGLGGNGLESPRRRHYIAPMPLVEAIDVDSGRTAESGLQEVVRTIYQYRGPKSNQHGRGFLGFDRVLARNLNQAVESVNEFRQDYPYTGMLIRAYQKREDTYTPAIIEGTEYTPPGTEPGNMISETLYTLALRSTGFSFFPYIQESVETDFDPNTGTAFRQIETNYVYDSYANPTNIDVKVHDGSNGDIHRVLTTNTYENWTASWCLGRLTVTEIRNTRPTYPGSGNLAPTARNRKSEFTYDATTCQLESEVLQPGASNTVSIAKSYLHDEFGNRIDETLGSGATARETITGWDNRGQFPTTVTNAVGHSETRVWDSKFAVVTSVTGPNGLATEHDYDEWGRRIRTTAPRATLYTDTTYSWCGSNGCSQEEAVYKIIDTTSDGTVNVTEYDRLGREVSAARQGLGGLWIRVDTYYDPLGRAYLTSLPYFEGDPRCWVLRKFDSVGRVTSERGYGPGAACSSGPPLEHTDGGTGLARITQYAYSGLTTTVTDPEGRQVVHVNNVMDRLRQACESTCTGAEVTEFDYDPLGGRSWVEDPDGNETHIGYNKRGFKLSQTDPDMGSWSYTYNAFGELVSQTDGKGVTTTMSYDDLGRIDQRTRPEGATTFEYDGDEAVHGKSAGKLTRTVAPNGYELQYTYDQYGDPKETLTKIDTDWYYTETLRDAYGRVERLIYPSNEGDDPADPGSRFQIGYIYDAFGQLSKIRRYNNGGYTATFWTANAQDAYGNVVQETLGNGLTTWRTHDRATGLLTGIMTADGPSQLQDLVYEWDLAGNLLERADHLKGWREEFTYDARHRLDEVKFATSLTGGAIVAATHAYDNLGNLTRKGQFTNYQYASGRPHAVTRVTTPSGNRTFTYDGNGNLYEARGAGGDLDVTWTSFNKPSYIDDAGNMYSQFSYGPDDTRFKQVSHRPERTETRRYVGDHYEKVTYSDKIEHVHNIAIGDRIVLVYKIFATGATQKRYLHHDHLGSVVIATDNSQNIKDEWSYDAWGKKRDPGGWTDFGIGVFSTSGNDITNDGFTGHEHLDHVGLVHMNGRIYSPEVGRFLSADPFVKFADSVQGWNRYAYVENNPLSNIDPSGFGIEKILEPFKAIGGWLKDPTLSTLPFGSFLAVAGYLYLAYTVVERLDSAVASGNSRSARRPTTYRSREQSGENINPGRFDRGHREDMAERLDRTVRGKSVASTDRGEGVSGASTTRNSASRAGNRRYDGLHRRKLRRQARRQREAALVQDVPHLEPGLYAVFVDSVSLTLGLSIGVSLEGGAIWLLDPVNDRALKYSFGGGGLGAGGAVVFSREFGLAFVADAESLTGISRAVEVDGLIGAGWSGSVSAPFFVFQRGWMATAGPAIGAGVGASGLFVSVSFRGVYPLNEVLFGKPWRIE